MKFKKLNDMIVYMKRPAQPNASDEKLEKYMPTANLTDDVEIDRVQMQKGGKVLTPDQFKQKMNQYRGMRFLDIADQLNKEGFVSVRGKPITDAQIEKGVRQLNLIGFGSQKKLSIKEILKEASPENRAAFRRGEISELKLRQRVTGKRSDVKRSGTPERLERARKYRKKVYAIPERRLKILEDRSKYREKLYKELGLAPEARNPKEGLWKDMVTTAQSSKPGERYKLKGGTKLNVGRPNFYGNKFTVVDRFTGEEFKFKNLEKKINSKTTGFNYADAIAPYEQKFLIQKTPGLRTELNQTLIPNWNPGMKDTAFEIQHVEGRKNNLFNTHLAPKSANLPEHSARINFERAWENSKTLSEKKASFQAYKETLPKGIESKPSMVVRPRQFGKRLPFADMLRNAKAQGANLPRGILKAAEDLEQGVKMYSSIGLPESVANFTSGMIDDVVQGRYGVGALKALGGAGVAYGIYDTAVAFGQGKSTPEMATRFFGLDPVYNKIRQYSRLDDESQEIQKKINYEKSFEAAQEDMMDEGLMGLRPMKEATDEEKQKLKIAKEKVDKEVQEENLERAEGRMEPMRGLVNMVKERISALSGQPYQVAFAEGGRVQLSEGGEPKDIGRRKFLKVMGKGGALIAALPFLGKFIKPVTKAAPEAMEVISRSANQMPEYLANLISKIKMMGESRIIGKMDSPDEFMRYDLGDYELFEGAGGARLKRVKDRGEYGYEEFEMEIKQDPETGGIEYEEVSVRPDQDGKMKDVDFGIDDDIHAEMKKFADED
jgi:hypothetical protein